MHRKRGVQEVNLLYQWNIIKKEDIDLTDMDEVGGEKKEKGGE